MDTITTVEHRYAISVERKINNTYNPRNGEIITDTFDLIRKPEAIQAAIDRYSSEDGVISVNYRDKGVQKTAQPKQSDEHASCREYENEFGTVALLNDAESPYCGHCIE